MPFGTANQLVLPFGLNLDAHFDNFFGERNAATKGMLQQAVVSGNESYFYLAGGEGVGKSHLAFAALRDAELQGRSAAYIALDELSNIADSELAELFESLMTLDLIVLDNIHDWLCNQAREIALFNLFNHLKASSASLILTSRLSVSQLQLTLSDLNSRLMSGLTLKLDELTDAEKELTLRQVAASRGLTMSQEVSSFIIRRSVRNMGQLLNVLDALDREAWIEKKMLTIPFVKKVMSW